MKQLYKIGILAFFSALSLSSYGGNDRDTLSVLTPSGDSENSVNTVKASSDEEENQPKIGLRHVRFSGFSRMIGYYRNMSKHYADNRQRGLNYPVNLTFGDGSGSPALMLNLQASPTANSQITLEMGFHTNLNGWGDGFYSTQSYSGGLYTPNGRIASIFSRFALEAKTRNDYGTFKIMAGGGMNWGKLSPFTLWTFQYRDDMFERYPWDPSGSNWNRYDWHYSLGDIPRDLRWGNRSIQGFRIDMEDLPRGFEGVLIYGRALGIWESYLKQFPQQTFAGRIGKNFKGKQVGINFYSQYGHDSTDARIDTNFTHGGEQITVDRGRTSQLILTADFKTNIKGKIRLYSEMGVGGYRDGGYFHEDTISDFKLGTTNKFKMPLSTILYTEADVKKALFGFPFKLSMYRVGRHAVNNAGAIRNSSIESAGNGLDFGNSAASRDNGFYLEGMITEIGQLTNNRQGTAFTTRQKFGKLVVELGLGIQQEIQNLGIYDTLPSGGIQNGQRLSNGNYGVRNSVSTYHLVNRLQRSRFEFTRRFYGPYNRLLSDYRLAWENIAITDNPNDIDYKKSFNMLDLTLKYKTTLFKKEIIFTAFGRANSVQENWAAIPKFGEKAFVRQWYEEFMTFYRLSNKFMVIGFVAFEQLKGNQRTELAGDDSQLLLDVNGQPAGQGTEVDLDQDGKGDGLFVNADKNGINGRPIDQRGFGIGAGFDWDFMDRASLDVRYRYIDHHDLNFKLDKFSGHDVSVEMKVFF